MRPPSLLKALLDPLSVRFPDRSAKHGKSNFQVLLFTGDLKPTFLAVGLVVVLAAQEPAAVGMAASFKLRGMPSRPPLTRVLLLAFYLRFVEFELIRCTTRPRSVLDSSVGTNFFSPWVPGRAC